MSAAIEGLQTCLHVGHSEGDTSSILTQNPLNYPLILIGFAIVGLVMQYCTLKAHEMLREELDFESLMDLQRGREKELSGAKGHPFQPLELDANNLTEISLADNDQPGVFGLPRSTDKTTPRTDRKVTTSSQSLTSTRPKTSTRDSSSNHLKTFTLNKRQSFELPDRYEDKNIQRISLRCLKHFDDNLMPDSNEERSQSIDPERASIGRSTDSHNFPLDRGNTLFWIRCLSSPLALISCALIILFVDSSWFTEISDATLALIIVIVLFLASYPNMKRAGKVLLQTAPDKIDLDKLKSQIKRTSDHILEVEEMHIWSLTAESDLVATCRLRLDQKHVTKESQVTKILQDVRFKFLECDIRCITIEPIIKIKTETEAVSPPPR